MLMQDTPIKVFDDSLSAVDMETDQKIRQSIRKNVHGTTILIAHRITTLMNADQILVLDHGRVSQLGTHQQLIAQEGIYKRIYEMQGASGSGDEAEGPAQAFCEKTGASRGRTVKTVSAYGAAFRRQSRLPGQPGAQHI